MAGWELVPCLVDLRGEFNDLAPGRDRASDGSIGDAAHRASSSDHNIDDGPDQGRTPNEDADSDPEVHAIDVDADLRKPGWSMERAVQIIVGRHRSGADDRLQNVIYNRRIWSASWGWTERDYTGSNPHDKHAHFGSRYTTAAENNDRRPWGLLADDEGEIDMSAEFFESVDRAVTGAPDATAADRTNRDRFARAVRFSLGLQVPDQTAANLPCGPAGLLEQINDKLPDGPPTSV